MLILQEAFSDAMLRAQGLTTQLVEFLCTLGKILDLLAKDLEVLALPH